LGFDWLEHDRDDLSGEAANTCNNGGTFYYVIWNQWQEDEDENVSNSDAIFRRVMFCERQMGQGRHRNPGRRLLALPAGHQALIRQIDTAGGRLQRNQP
jgi:hypothetical protein